MITESKPTSAISPIGVIAGTGAGAGIAYKYCVTLTVSPGDNSIAFVSLFPQRYVIALSLPAPAMVRPVGVKLNAKSYTPGDGVLPQAANCKRSGGVGGGESVAGPVTVPTIVNIGLAGSFVVS